MMSETWSCHICRVVRPDAAISVISVDTSGAFGLPRGTMHQNIRYCNDNASCEAAAPQYRHAKGRTE